MKKQCTYNLKVHKVNYHQQQHHHHHYHHHHRQAMSRSNKMNRDERFQNDDEEEQGLVGRASETSMLLNSSPEENAKGRGYAAANDTRQAVEAQEAAMAAAEAEASHKRVRSDFSFFAAGHNQMRKSGSHHRRRSSISRFMGSVGDGLGTLAEDVQDTAISVRRGWLEEMHDADSGRKVFLETGMMRNLSILPNDMEDLMEKLPGMDGPGSEEGDDDSSSKFSLGPYLSLLGAVLAISSNGTALSLQAGVAPALKLFWRMTAVTIVLMALAARSFWNDGLPKLNFGQWTTMGLAVVCYVAQNLCFVIALNYTSIGNVVVFANTQAVLLLAGKALTGTRVSCLEAVGAIVAFGGALLCATDEHRDEARSDDEVDQAWLGDILAMASALLGVGYLTFAKAVRPATSVISFMFIMMSTGSLLILCFMLLTNEHITLSIHPYHGLFGWMDITRSDRFLVELWIVLVCSLIGTMGFVRSMQYFDSIIIAVATLLEPMIASIIATIMDVGVLPGPQGWIGNAFVIVGTFCVVYPSAAKGEGGGH